MSPGSLDPQAFWFTDPVHVEKLFVITRLLQFSPFIGNAIVVVHFPKAAAFLTFSRKHEQKHNNSVIVFPWPFCFVHYRSPNELHIHSLLIPE